MAATAEPSAAVEVLEQASAMAERLDARTELAVASSELRSLGIRSWRRGPSARGIDPRLRGRPRDVARLVARGATNPEIAAALMRSRKTVESHVSTLLARCEVRNRTELARRLADAPGLDLEG
jgi:DNA-binding NarL/FixJ family response regulator